MSYSNAEEDTTPRHDEQGQQEASRPVKKRKQINDAQRQAMRRYAAQWATRHGKRTPHTHLREWFEATYGWSIAMSIVGFIMSEKFTYLDTEELARPDAKRNVAPNWPDLEAALWDWQQHYEELHDTKVSGDALRDQAQQLWSSMEMYKDKSAPNFSSGWITGYKERHGARTKRKPKEGPTPARNITLTEWLFKADPTGFHKACHEVEFFSLLAQGQVSASAASSFLDQERFKILAEIKYLGGLLTKLPLSSTGKHHSRILNTIIEEINCLQARLRLLDDTLPLYTPLLPSDESPDQESTREPTRETLTYTTFLTPSSSVPLIPSLSLYWTTLKLHYTAFTAANLRSSSLQSVSDKHRAQNDPNYDPLAQDLDTGILRRWIMPQFMAEDVGARMHKLGGLLNSIEISAEERSVCGQLWRQALWTFEGSWPVAGSDGGGREDDITLQLNGSKGYAPVVGHTSSPSVARGAGKRGRGRPRGSGRGESAGTNQRSAHQSAYDDDDAGGEEFARQLRMAVGS